MYWKCPKDSCTNEQIEIRRSEDSSIIQSTYRDVIEHFLIHLSLNEHNKYFTSREIYEIFKAYTPDDILNERDEELDGNEIRWQHKIRSALGNLSQNGFIESNKRDMLPSKYQRIFKGKSTHVWERTGKFLGYYLNKTLNDWELYQFWKCPMNSCGHKEITINRVNNVIDTPTYSEIIIHFLKHLKKSNIFLGTKDIQEFFLKNSPPDILSNEDRESYSDSSIKWKNRIRSALGTYITIKMGYLETVDINEIPDIYNKDITDLRELRMRRRTNKFYRENEDEFYNDLEIYSVEKVEEIMDIEEEEIEELEIEQIYQKFSELGEEAVSHLFSGKNLIFYGPPGTGKTRKARNIADFLCNKNHYSFETAHAEWTAYDVVGGPTIAGNGKLNFKPGFLTWAAIKGNDQSNPHWLIIDEINRANLDLAFGKIFTFLDIEYRNIKFLDNSDLLELENKEFYEDLLMPKNFRILSTMNTYDKAILFSMGYAFRRRFAFIEVGSPFIQMETMEYEFHEENWVQEIKDLENQILDEFKKEIENWIENDQILKLSLKFKSFQEKFIQDLKRFNQKINNNELFPLDPYKFAYKLASRLTAENIIEIGYSEPIDLIKYVLIKGALFPKDDIKKTILKAIDEGVKAYFIPQMEHYLPIARRLKTLGEGDEGEIAISALKNINKEIFKKLSLKKSKSVVDKFLRDLGEEPNNSY